MLLFNALFFIFIGICLFQCYLWMNKTKCHQSKQLNRSERLVHIISRRFKCAVILFSKEGRGAAYLEYEIRRAGADARWLQTESTVSPPAD